MMIKEKNDLNPFLVKFGVALALSFAGFFYSRFIIKRNKPSLPPPLPRSSDHDSEVDSRGKGRRVDDLHALKTNPSCCNVVSKRYEETYVQKVTIENSTIGLSPSSRHNGDKDGFLLPEFQDLVKEFDFTGPDTRFSPKKDVDTPKSDLDTPREFRSAEMDNYEQEIRHLSNMVRVLQERERDLEVQLLEYYGLKEQEAATMELQNRLKINNMEAKLLSLKIESLQSDNRRLEAQVADNAKVVSELEAARSKIKLLKKKLRSEAQDNKEQITVLQKRVAKLQEQEYEAVSSDPHIELKLQRIKDLEGEAEDLRKSNMRLQMENSELTQKLESTQILANSVLEDTETELLKQMSDRLSQENEDLRKEIEQLQTDRCADVEELVYLRWINACLRHELRNYQPPPGKTIARDLSKTLSPKSEEKAKQLILEYANVEGINEKDINIMEFDSDRWSTSQNSYITDSENLDDSSIDNSSATKTNTSSKVKFFSKLRRLIRGKDGHHPNQNSSGQKNVTFEDNDSPGSSSRISTGTDPVGELHNDRVTSPSHSRYRHSLDIQRLRSIKEDNMKDIRRGQRNSDVGSSYGYKRLVLGGEGASDLAPDLIKFAGALKDSRSRIGKLHKRSASFSFG
ncbi:hypothetical protein CFOL_v3_19406 [Cephalotus follicularis]|uniref:Uncharacterized protein n=1 Tax=Cephalotus follicularis TaxID=3775 RepID=A0A1Q3C6T8_CEPFO|nr:hypothetical protein CFOL_v3_19406 [Cephalotus follicularis]